MTIKKIIRLFAFLSGYFVVAIAVFEVALRLVFPNLAPGHLETVNEIGLSLAKIATVEQQLTAGQPKSIVIGDSFVATGRSKGGWLNLLNEKEANLVNAIGVEGSAPGHYFWLYDLVRKYHAKIPIIIVIYIGNDFADESILLKLGPNKSKYFFERYKIYRDVNSKLYWPCSNVARFSNLKQILNDYSILYRVLVLTKHRLIGFQKKNGAESQIKSLMLERCRQPPYSVAVRDRTFFFDHHKALLNLSDREIRDARENILKSVGNIKDDPNLQFVVVLGREEVCRSFHLRSVASAREFVGALRGLGTKVLDPTKHFEKACAKRQLFLPDGHWNHNGHQLFAQWLFTKLPKRDSN